MDDADPDLRDDTEAPATGWTAAVRRRAVRALPPDRLLPDKQPSYVASWVYVFGVLTLSALVVALVSGGLLALYGPAWWHGSSVGHFVNSTHLWSVELFFAFMVIHLWGKFFMAAWRGRRALTWITGVLAFVGSIGTAFTGYLVQQNFDSQWISTQAKDGLNAVGIGAYFNVLDFGQMLLWHVVLLPLVIGVLTVLHILLVRRRGVVEPLPYRRRDGGDNGPDGPAEASPAGAAEQPGAASDEARQTETTGPVVGTPDQAPQAEPTEPGTATPDETRPAQAPGGPFAPPGAPGDRSRREGPA
ncbi:cytochrome b N-terminal domain-containing protein [Actinocatenispora rupis]|uniref:Cytochrome bc1 complex cytochrome b subunit n=1 Tax=Actinocatenispora rupis TaxID=519421 RepID=A0A8J3JBV0_9ACTN|nr:cytochrome b N-terminal domain-containing protein [Actinocatenispora rupis]GID15511.1 hypothetical protein Aru02nite_64000 [Actinocatenispora rupis]